MNCLTNLTPDSLSRRGVRVGADRKVVVILKGYPRLTETFIAQELLGLQKAGFDLSLVSMRHPTDKKRHPVHDEITAPVMYLPEYLYQEPLRVLRSLWSSRRRAGFGAAWRAFLADLRHDLSPNRIRRFGQAAVLAAEWPAGAAWLHAHFIHTPGSVARYTSLMTGVPFTVSAHAKDIWTQPDAELALKLAAAHWVVTCTPNGYAHLQSLAADPARVHLSFHGLDLARFGPSPLPRSNRDGSDAASPVQIVSVGRAVEKKGYDVLLRALALLPADLNWRFLHIGGGKDLPALKAIATELGLSDRIDWQGSQAQEAVLDTYRHADIFALACRIASDGDRDGLPNVLVEASSQGLVCVSTNISGIPALLTDAETGLVVPPDDAPALAKALEQAIRTPALRHALGQAAEAKVRTQFDMQASIRQLSTLFTDEWNAAP